jgi:hypothetical protein
LPIVVDVHPQPTNNAGQARQKGGLAMVTRPESADERPLSPYTGWTRQTWETLADSMLAAVRPYASPQGSLVDLPGPASRSGRWSDGLEGFARTFLLAGFRLARSGDEDPANLAEWYATGLDAGTDPSSPQRWPTFAECQQAKVEGASIAIALHETRRWIWDRLDDAVRQRIVAWLAGILDDPIWDNNWTWFQAIMEAFLRSVGGPWRAEDIDRTLDRTESWYVGGGWYSDGTRGSDGPRNFDYYCGWAMQFYPLWYCRISGADADDELLTRYRDRLTRYLADARYLIAADGAPLIQGRSLTYRFAMLAPFWTGAVFDATPLRPGATRRLASGVVRHFVTEGCFDSADLLPLGWHREFPAMRQPYSGPGSPYWASKAFAGLVLPADHPVWTAREEALPIESADIQLTLPAPGWLVSGTVADGIVRVAAHGPDHASLNGLSLDQPEYARHGYATHAAPEVEHANPVDSHIALLTQDGRASHRRPVSPLRLDGRIGVSRSRAHWLVGPPSVPWETDGQEDWTTGPLLTTATVLRGPWEVRLARVDAAPDTVADPLPTQDGPLRLRIGGWAIADTEPPGTQVAGATATVDRADGLTSTVSDLRGLTSAGCSRSRERNPLGRHSATPWAGTDEPVTFGRIYAALVVLSGVPTEDGVRLTVAGDLVTVHWPDDEQDQLTLPGPGTPVG